MTDLIEQVSERGLSLVEKAGVVDVYDAASADEAGRLLMQVKAQLNAIDDARKQITKPLDEAKSRAMEQARQAKAPFEEAKSHLEGAILGWNLAERKRLAEEVARAERERVELEVAAQRAAEEGRLDDAASLQMQRDATGVTEKVHRAAGTTARYMWTAEVTDVDALVDAVAKSGGTLTHLLTPNQSALNAYAKATKGKANLPGVQFIEKPSLASTGRA